MPRDTRKISFACSFFQSSVELTQERADHIATQHPDFFPKYAMRIPETLLEPDLVRQDPNRPDCKQFIKFYAHLNTIVAVIVTTERNFIGTAYNTSKVPQGGILWQKKPSD